MLIGVLVLGAGALFANIIFASRASPPPAPLNHRIGRLPCECDGVSAYTEAEYDYPENSHGVQQYAFLLIQLQPFTDDPLAWNAYHVSGSQYLL